MISGAQIVVVPDGTTKAGCLTWWRVSDITSFEALKAEWLRHDLPENELPSTSSDNSALHRALNDLYRKRHVLVRVLPNNVYAVVAEDVHDGKEDPEYDTNFKCWIDFEKQELAFDRDIDEAEVDQIAERFSEARLELTTNEMSGWFVRRAQKVNGIRLRESGGIYFIPETSTQEWSKFSDIVAAVSQSKIYEVPALKTERAVEAIMDAVIASTQQEVDQLTALLDAKEDGMSERGLRNKAKVCDALAEKLRKYEALLGVRMVEMQSVLETVDGRIADMLLTLEADE